MEHQKTPDSKQKLNQQKTKRVFLYCCERAVGLRWSELGNRVGKAQMSKQDRNKEKNC
jgi:hypothetical protein